MSAKMSYVYVLSNGAGQCKIGKADNVEARIKGMSAALCGDISLVYKHKAPRSLVYKIEGKAHDYLALSRGRGEWFAVSSEEAVSAVKDAAKYYVGDVEDTDVISELESSIGAFNDSLAARKSLREEFEELETAFVLQADRLKALYDRAARSGLEAEKTFFQRGGLMAHWAAATNQIEIGDHVVSEE